MYKEYSLERPLQPKPDELYHFGIKGQKWGIRRFQNPDGTLTEEGKKRYLKYNEDGSATMNGRAQRAFTRLSDENSNKGWYKDDKGKWQNKFVDAVSKRSKDISSLTKYMNEGIPRDGSKESKQKFEQARKQLSKILDEAYAETGARNIRFDNGGNKISGMYAEFFPGMSRKVSNGSYHDGEFFTGNKEVDFGRIYMLNTFFDNFSKDGNLKKDNPNFWK